MLYFCIFSKILYSKMCYWWKVIKPKYSWNYKLLALWTQSPLYRLNIHLSSNLIENFEWVLPFFFIILVWTIYKKVYLSIDKKEDMLIFQQAGQHNGMFCPNNRRFWLWEQLTGSWRAHYSMANDSEGVFITH